MNQKSSANGMLPNREKNKAIGNLTGEHQLVTYVIQDGCVAIVTAHRDRGGCSWSFVGTLDNEVVISGTVRGGKWRAARYIHFIRNGIVSKRMKGKVNRLADEV